MKHLNFLSKSSSRSCGHRVTTLASTVGSPSAHRRGAMLRLLSVLVLVLTIGVGNVWGTNWNKITNLSDLSNGDSILVVIQDGKTLTSGKAFKVGGTTSANSVDVTITSNSYISDPANNTKWAVNSSTSNNITTYTFTNGNSNKIRTGSTSNNKIGGNASGDYYIWYISKLSDGYFKVQCGNSDGMYMSWTGSIFGKYANSYFVNQMNLSTKVNLAANHGAISFYKKAASTTPTITKSSSMTTLTYSNGSPVAQSFTIGGSNLTNTVTVTAPTDYEVCKTVDGTYESSISFTNTEVNAANKTVYIRLQSGLSAGEISSRNITIASEDATTQTIAVTGSVPYKIIWMANGSEHATTYVAVGSTLALPATDPVPNTCGCTGKAFYGWYGGGTSYKNASVAPTIAAAGNTVNADKTYYAVFATASGGDPVNEWRQCTSLSDFVDGDFYLFVSPSYNSTYYYVPAVSSTTAANNFSKAGEAVASNSTPTSVTKAQGAWKLIKSGTAWKIQSSNSSTTYLYATNDNNGLAANTATNASYTWSITKHSTTSTFAFQYNSSRYLCAYNTSPYGFRTYPGTSTNGTAYLTVYHWASYTPTTYSNYETNCCTPLGSINGSFFWTTHFCPVRPAKHRS